VTVDETLIESAASIGLGVTHLGAVVVVYEDGAPATEVAVGERASGARLQIEDAVPWFSVSKILSSIGIARAWELGYFGLDDPVGDYLDGFGSVQKKQDIALRHVWTHCAPILTVDRSLNTSMTVAQAVERIEAAEPDGWAPGTRGGYLGHAGALILAEVVERCTGITFNEFIEREVVGPLGLRSRFGIVGSVIDVPFLGRPPTRVRFDADARFPSNGVTGPFADAVFLCELLRRGGELETRVLSEATTSAVTAPQRVGLYDEVRSVAMDFGLGVAFHDPLFGPASSPQTFGHVGATSSVVYSDPKIGRTVGLFFNGNCALPQHQERCHRVAQAIDRVLGAS
jgi:CubicO group peptidase (beta-lactamase class C family)